MMPRPYQQDDAAQPASSPAPPGAPATNPLAARVTQLEAEMQSLRDLLSKLATVVGEEAIAQAVRPPEREEAAGGQADKSGPE